MQSNASKKRGSLWARGFAALCAALAMAALGSGASAAPTETVLYSFKGGTTDGANPVGGLIADSSGNRYGTTSSGGGAGLGTVFTLSGGTSFSLLHSFGGSDGARPAAGLIRDSSGNLYGTTPAGTGVSVGGEVFELSGGTSFSLLHSFAGGPNGSLPVAGLIRDSSGNLYGTAENNGNTSAGLCAALGGCGVVFQLSPGAVAYTYMLLQTFSGGDGANPAAGLIRDSSGNLYGTTENGGAQGSGAVFEISSGGIYTVLYSFCVLGSPCSDGANPQAGLYLDSSGNLYGTTTGGGGSSNCAGGCGGVFKLSPNGTSYTFALLHSFAGGTSDGTGPFAGLIADSSGNLYGTTEFGGASDLGTVFKLAPDGTSFALLYSFAGGTNDGAVPQAGLIADSIGNLYGTTNAGGASASACPASTSNFNVAGCGVVFELTGTGFGPTLQVMGPATIVANAAQGGAAIFSLPFAYTLKAVNGSVQVSILASGFPPGIPAWLNPSITSATVTPNTPVADTISLINLGSLARGSYNATVSFTNTTNHQGDTAISATLRIYNKDDCKNGGWRNFISPPGPFPNQGQCVSYFANLMESP